MNFFFLEIRLILDQVNGLFNVFVGFRSVPVFEAAQGDAIVRVVTLSVNGQGELVPGHCLCKFKLVFIAIRKVYHRIEVFLILCIWINGLLITSLIACL